MKGCIPEANLERQGGWDIFKKERTPEKGRAEIEDWGFSVHFLSGFQVNSICTLHLCFSFS